MNVGRVIVLSLLFGVLLSFCEGEREEKLVWYSNLDSGLVMAKESGKPLLVEFSASWCPYCRMFEDSTLSDRRVMERLKRFVLVRVNVDSFPAIADSLGANARKYGGVGIPNVLFLTSEGDRLKQVIGFKPPEEFCVLLDSVIQTLVQ